MLKWIDRYASAGLEGVPENEQSKRYAFAIICFLGGVAALAYSAYYAAYDFEGLRPVWITSLVCTPVLVLPLVARQNVVLAVAIGLVIVIGVFSTLSYLTGTGTGLFLFMLAGLLAVILVLGTDHLWFVFLITCVTTIAMLANFILFQEPAGAARVDPFFQQLTFGTVIVVLSLMIVVGVYSLAMRVARAEEALAAEHARSEALLMNLLPEEIAMRLKERPGEVIADGLPAVTLLFADIVDFTPRSATRPPAEVVSFLNQIFSRFDELTAERGVEKIKTIGDAYMVAAGLPMARGDHAEVIADMALAMQAAVTELSDQMGEAVNLRIGIHSGPAIAGVIGTSKVFYDVWGDTVNTASRMESHGAPGRIQVTSATHALLGDGFVFDDRGVIDIKGKGPVKTYWLIGRAA
jgi:class 3 adenylate cyclase